MRLAAAILLFSWGLPPPAAVANDFPTLARVEYVLRCMEVRGGQKYENLYSCSCILDKIADSIPYDDYVEADVYFQLQATPGERGGMFRDPDQARILVKKLTALTDAAEKSCVVGTEPSTADKKDTAQREYEES